MARFVETTRVFALKKNEENGKKGIDHPLFPTIDFLWIACGDSLSS